MPFPKLQILLMYMRRAATDVLLSLVAFCTVTILPMLQTPGRKEVLLAIPGLWKLVGVYTVMAVLAVFVTRTYRMIWRYVSFRDFLRLIAAASIAQVGFVTVEVLLLESTVNVPGFLLAWTMVVLWLANVGFLAAPRFLARAIHEVAALRGSPAAKAEPVLLTGEMARMENFVRDCLRDPASRYQIVGVLLDDERLHGSYFHGVRVLGDIKSLRVVMARLKVQGHKPSTLVVAADEAGRTDFAHLLELTTTAGLKIGRLPAPGSFSEDAPVRPIELSDLLGRPEIKIDMNVVAGMVRGKCVLVTGGGGSIGSEICRQVARLKPSRLVVLDSGEFNLYAIDGELATTHPEVPRDTALVDVRDAALVSHWIGRTQPAIVFHAAALKHVPLIEDHPLEGIKTNVFGTMNVAEACRTHQVPAMVMISTDKAVNPTNVMGATKRLAEAYCQGLDLGRDAVARTRFMMVRFGNVLGSNGSVVPLFRRQIEAGGPVTVTHPDITRYFMTIPEAVTLVMMAGAQGMEQLEDRGNIYLLDMGKPVKIVDLAREMIRLSGHRPDIDIKIEFVGLRPGEKLFEELSYFEEAVKPTASKSISKLMPRATDLRIMRQQLQELRQACTNEDRERALRLLRISVPDYVAAPVPKAVHS